MYNNFYNTQDFAYFNFAYRNYPNIQLYLFSSLLSLKAECLKVFSPASGSPGALVKLRVLGLSLKSFTRLPSWSLGSGQVE